jgi:hypothetical protein
MSFTLAKGAQPIMTTRVTRAQTERRNARRRNRYPDGWQIVIPGKGTVGRVREQKREGVVVIGGLSGLPWLLTQIAAGTVRIRGAVAHNARTQQTVPLVTFVKARGVAVQAWAGDEVTALQRSKNAKNGSTHRPPLSDGQKVERNQSARERFFQPRGRRFGGSSNSLEVRP